MSETKVIETKKSSALLRCSFNTTELLDLGKKLSETHSKLAELLADKKRIVSEFTAKITAVQAEALSLSGKVSNGYELRDTPTTEFLDEPEHGKKRIVRDDTGEEVEIVKMNAAEMQRMLDLREAADHELKNPALPLDSNIIDISSGNEKDQTDAANEAANPDPDATKKKKK